jgi:hypothetical protein
MASGAELLFIHEELDLFGEYLVDLFTDTIEVKNLIDSGDLLDSLQYVVTVRGGEVCLSLRFEDHGRYIEINYFKKRKSIWEIVDTRKAMWGIKSKSSKNKKKKDTRWYTKNVYGSLNRLIGRIGSGATDEYMTSLKNYVLENPNWSAKPYVNRYIS